MVDIGEYKDIDQQETTITCKKCGYKLSRLIINTQEELNHGLEWLYNNHKKYLNLEKDFNKHICIDTQNTIMKKLDKILKILEKK